MGAGGFQPPADPYGSPPGMGGGGFQPGAGGESFGASQGGAPQGGYGASPADPYGAAGAGPPGGVYGAPPGGDPNFGHGAPVPPADNPYGAPPLGAGGFAGAPPPDPYGGGGMGGVPYGAPPAGGGPPPQDYGAQMAGAPPGFQQQQQYGAPAPYPGAGPMMQPGMMQVGAGGPPKQFMITLLLCLFGGALGAHRFYSGHILFGVIQFFTGGGCGVWWAIDLFLIVTGKYTDAQGRPLQKS